MQVGRGARRGGEAPVIILSPPFLRGGGAKNPWSSGTGLRIRVLPEELTRYRTVLNLAPITATGRADSQPPSSPAPYHHDECGKCASSFAAPSTPTRPRKVEGEACVSSPGMRRLALPHRISNWSLTSLQQRLVKTGGRLIKHARYYWLLLAESHLTRRLFGSMLLRIAGLSLPAG
jgi:hypothetical protein